MFQLKGISKSFGGTPLFQDVTWVLNPGDRVGLVGPNGIGKTTLLRIFAGEESADGGEIVRPRAATIGYLAQEVDRAGSGRVVDEVLAAAEEVRRLERELDGYEQRLAAVGTPEEAEALAHRHAEALERFQVLGGYDLEARAREILKGLGFTQREMDRNLDQLSGGWVTRVALARLLLVQPDLLLLDEPTNHLDMENLEWIEGFLSQYPGAWAVVSHDRYFLNRVVDRIAELTPDGLFTYEGNYDDFLEARVELEAQLAKEQAAYDRRRKEIQSFVDRFRAKASKARQAQSRVRMLEKMEAEMKPPPAPRRSQRRLSLELPEPPRSGATVLTMEDVHQAYGDKVVYTGVNVALQRGERVVLVGTNGAGKSTLLKMMAGVLKPDRGRRVLGHNVESFYFAQHQAETLDPEATVYECLREVMPDENVTRVRSVLGAFLFSGDTVEKKVGVLSGGEKSRLALARMLARPANLLLLDEPTNHLDLPSREVLEEVLADFQGTVVFISHDRYFINRVATKVIEVKPVSIVHEFPGDWDYYLWKRARMAEEAEAVAAVASGNGEDRARRKSSAAQEREARKAAAREAARQEKEAARLEAEIARLEGRMKEIDQILCDPGVYADGERTKALLDERTGLEEGLPELYEQWTALAG